VKTLTIALVAASLGALWFAVPASASCSMTHGDPPPGYQGPLLYGIHCAYVTGPTESWTVPAITEAEFDLFGASDPIGGHGGRVKATLAVVPGEILVLESGGNGTASSVSRDGVPLLIAGGGDGGEPNYVSPDATKTQVEAPGTPITGNLPDGQIFVAWSVPRDPGPVVDPDSSTIDLEPPIAESGNCVVPRLTGRRPLAARRSLSRSGCRAGTVTRKPSAPRKRRRVLSQSMQPGTELPPGSEVRFAVGSYAPRL
jgi:hypothetical protein